MLKLTKYLKPFQLPIYLVLVLVLLQSLAELYLPTLMSDIVDKGVITGDTDYIWKIGGFMMLVAAGGMICSIAASFFSAKAASGFGKSLRSKLFSHVSNFSLHEFDQLGTASLITRTTNDITQIQQVLVMMLRMMAMAPMMCIGGIIMAYSKDSKLTLVLAVSLPVLVLAIVFIASKGMPLFKAMQVKLDKLNRVLRENLTGIRVIRSFNRIDYEKNRFNEANWDLTQTAIQVNKLMAAMMPIMMLVLNLSTVAIIWFGGLRISSGHMQVGDMMAFIQYAMQIMFSFIMLSMMFVMIPRASVSAVRINEVLQTVADISDPPVTSLEEGIQGQVEFKDVTFSYPGAEMPAIENISFKMKPGEVTAIIGGTGSGKSTLINLIPRFYDVDSGAVLINGVDVRQLTQEKLRKKIGFVPQQAVLFTGSISENIRYGKEDATDDEVQHAATIAQASEFITTMEDGYNAMIAQGGTNVSGGQKQRLSIARALVRKPEIYIFDDSFSALDFKTDAKLRAALKEETGDSTLLIVAQRVSTIMDADQIIVLDHGRIAGIGAHKELLETCPVYREIVLSQLSEEEIA
ncbi:ATP-binding cassette subfamily B multidrug efflux pump [Bacillus sp. SORGH_AS 510]|uniref:ABC transporter ATP-binding protein n=1 Tax=Bacillus sp. SORGH_AS_0510 TaxID=3041771 RepID=UPI0027883C56|nr:ABC transporter ATP-binding protein [Bacillus sp. SORGH_AS_0510]MDQ1145868.1 ATP-binding cassette subfamily B multidrug efflux pump [Bacillus sp. SORGH_AS_0510]